MSSYSFILHKPFLSPVLPTNSRRCHQRETPIFIAATQHSVFKKTPYQYAPCIPESAKEITDSAAQQMLQRIEYTPITTNLSQSIIKTSHVKSKSNDSSKPALIFLHGFDSNLLEYRYMLPMIDEQPYTAHFVDILGWGFTECPISSSFSYAPSSKRQHLFAFLSQIVKQKNVVLIGASIGAAVAIDFALEYPHLVKALVLIDGQAFTDKKQSVVMQLPGLAAFGAEILRSRWLRSIAVQLSYQSEQLKCDNTLLIGGLHCKGQGWKQAAINFIKGEGYCLSERVEEITCPVKVLWGDNDRVLPREDAQKFMDVISDCQLEYVKESGHSPHIEKPKLVTQAILRFVSQLPLSPK